MKTYNKPIAQVVELAVKESLSALPNGFSFNRMAKLSNATYKNVAIYTKSSTPSTKG